MTWNELKAHIDAALEAEGQTGEIDVWYVDVSHPQSERIEVEVGNSSLTVWTHS